MIKFDGFESKNKAIGLFSIFMFLAVSILKQQPGSSLIFAHIAYTSLIGRINFEAKINDKHLFPILGIMSILSAVSINLLNSIYWGLGELILNSFAIAILTRAYRRGKE